MYGLTVRRAVIFCEDEIGHLGSNRNLTKSIYMAAAYKGVRSRSSCSHGFHVCIIGDQCQPDAQDASVTAFFLGRRWWEGRGRYEAQKGA